MPRLAQFPGKEQILQIPHRGRETVRERRHVDDPRIARRHVHLSNFIGVQTQGFFAQDVLPVCGSLDGNRFVRVVRRRNHHRVDVRIGANLFEISSYTINVPRLPTLLEQLPARVTSRYQLGSRIQPDARNVMIVAHRPCPDDRDAYHFRRLVKGFKVFCQAGFRPPGRIPSELSCRRRFHKPFPHRAQQVET